MTYYYISDKYAVGKKDDDGNAYLYDADFGWVKVDNYVIDDYLYGFDPSEEIGSPYRFGNGDIMHQISVIEADEAEKKIAEKLNDLGWDFQNGLHADADMNKARECYLKAGELGYTKAMVNLGNMAEDAGDYEEAYSWYKKAYLAGDQDGYYNYANMYHWGWYVEKDEQFAYQCFRELTDNNYPPAYFYVGHYLQEGIAVEKNLEEAFSYFKTGADLKDACCTTEVGRCYCLGLGVEKDERTGLAYYMEGADLGDTLAYANLGYAFENGQGTEKDLVAAEHYYQQGANLGDEICIEELKRIKRLTKAYWELLDKAEKDHCYFGTISEPFVKNWKEINEERDPFDVLCEENRHIFRTDMFSICQYGDDWFGNRRIRIDWGSYAWKISKEKMKELLEENGEEEELSDDKEYGVVFIEGV